MTTIFIMTFLLFDDISIVEPRCNNMPRVQLNYRKLRLIIPSVFKSPPSYRPTYMDTKKIHPIISPCKYKPAPPIFSCFINIKHFQRTLLLQQITGKDYEKQEKLLCCEQDIRTLPRFALIHDFRNKNLSGNVFKISINHRCYCQTDRNPPITAHQHDVKKVRRSHRWL